MRHKAHFVIVFFAALMLFLSSALAQTDSLNVRPRNFSDQAIDQTIRDNKAFRYDDGPLLAAPGAWERFWMWVWDKWNALMNRPGTGKFIQYFLLVVAVGIIVFAVIKLLGMQGFFFIGKKSEEARLDHEELINDIHEIPFEKRIEESISKKQYRLAVRLLYLQTLRQLNDRALIHWKKEKTNAAYVRELKEPLHHPFSRLTREFEYVWYGEFALDEPQFFTLKNSFSAFADDLKKA